VYANDNLSSLTTPSGQIVTYGYSQGRLTSISVNGILLLNGLLYEPFGPVRQWTWGNGTLAARTYDAGVRVTQIDSGGDLSNYRYNDANRLRGIENTSSAALSWDLGYTSRDHLAFGVSVMPRRFLTLRSLSRPAAD
jgi:YD repeat-containing protein